MNFVFEKSVTAMAKDPIPKKTPKEIEQMYKESKTEKNLAYTYALVHNKYWWIEDDLYDFEEGSKEYKELEKEVNSWNKLLEKLEKEIFDILEKEGIKIPKTSRIKVFEPFMLKNGFVNGDGWWITNKGEKENRKVGLEKDRLDCVVSVASSDIKEYFKNSKSGKNKEYYAGLAEGLYYVADTLADNIGIQNEVNHEHNYEDFIKLVKKLEKELKKNDKSKSKKQIQKTNKN